MGVDGWVLVGQWQSIRLTVRQAALQKFPKAQWMLRVHIHGTIFMRVYVYEWMGQSIGVLKRRKGWMWEVL